MDGRVAPTAEMQRRLEQGAVRAPLGLALTDADGAIEWINGTFTQLTGLTWGDVFGRNRFDLLLGPVTQGDEISRVRAEVAAGRQVITEFETCTKDGRPYWTSFTVSPGREDGRLAYLVVSEEDVTDRRRSAEEVRAATRRNEASAEALRIERELLANVLSTIPHVVFWKDLRHRYLGCNDAYARLRGVIGPDALTGRSETEVRVEDELGPIIVALEQQVLATDEPVIDHKIGLPGAGDGDHRTMLLSILPRHTVGATPAGVIGVGTDVTRISELEQQLAQATRLESIGQLAAGLAHEINTPIQYVSDNILFLKDSFADVLRALGAINRMTVDAEGDPTAFTGENVRLSLMTAIDNVDLAFLCAEIPGALEQTLEGVERVGEIVRAMKEFSHPGVGRMDTDLNRAVQSTVQVCRNEWKYVATLGLDLDPDLGMVPCYEGELKQVILNLIVNSAHAIADRRAVTENTELNLITISTRRDGATIRIRITDDGIGMDAATRLRIFDPFFTTKEVGKGTGQGLTLARNCIVGKHGGSIDVESALGVGTTFTLNLPAVAPTDPEQAVDPAGWPLGDLP